jgi:molybdopterin-guanine dinucleotide biosynthesis protein MobB
MGKEPFRKTTRRQGNLAEILHGGNEVAEASKLKTAIIAVLGSKKSGKTTTIETLIERLTMRGYRIAAVKHVAELNFTIDAKGKDSWRFAQAGAKTIITVADNEVATIEKMNTKNLPLDEILQKCRGNDVVFIEGLRSLVGKDRRVQKIVIARTAKEALKATKSFEPILAFAGSYSTENLKLKIAYVDVLKDSEKLADIIDDFIKKSKNGT